MWVSPFVTTVSLTEVNCAFVGETIFSDASPHTFGVLVIFVAAGQRLWDRLKINSGTVYSVEETREPFNSVAHSRLFK